MHTSGGGVKDTQPMSPFVASSRHQKKKQKQQYVPAVVVYLRHALLSFVVRAALFRICINRGGKVAMVNIRVKPSTCPCIRSADRKREDYNARGVYRRAQCVSPCVQLPLGRECC